jgi:hypothetical protein
VDPAADAEVIVRASAVADLNYGVSFARAGHTCPRFDSRPAILSGSAPAP